MAETHVLSALHNKYRQIKGELAALDNQCGKLRDQLVHLEQTITLFDDEWAADDATPKRPRKPSRWTKRGQGLQTALTVLREATAPLSAREIIIEVTRRLGYPIRFRPAHLAEQIVRGFLAHCEHCFERQCAGFCRE
jgi:hypothetical protein